MTATFDSAGFRLAELDEVPVWVPQEAADLGAPVMRGSEERGAPGAQSLIGGLAVSHAQGHRVTDPVGVRGRLEDHAGLVGGRAAPGDQQAPGNRPSLPVGLTSALLTTAFAGISPRDFPHFGHITPEPARTKAATLKP